MSRTLAKIALDGQDLTEFVPVKCKSQLGTVTGHVMLPLHLQVEPNHAGYSLRLKDDRDIRISFSGMLGARAYFTSVGDPSIR